MAVMLVALFARAWIEITVPNLNIKTGDVALFARAWIEICCAYPW